MAADALPDQSPALQPPLGVIPNFSDPEDMQNIIIATLAATLGAATLFTVIRMYTKAFILNSVASEDCSSLLSREVTIVLISSQMRLAWHGYAPKQSFLSRISRGWKAFGIADLRPARLVSWHLPSFQLSSSSTALVFISGTCPSPALYNFSRQVPWAHVLSTAPS